MAITISGENNNDRILASDGVIDQISGINIVGVLTATSFTGDLTGDVTGNLTGNVTGNINNTTLLLQTGGTERVRIDSSGRVLIGTTTEGHENADDLTIATSGTGGITIRTGTSNSGSIYFSDATSGTAEYAGFVGYSHANNSMIFGTNGGEKLRIMSNGYFGFGINSPSRRIHVHTTGSGSDYMQFTNDTTGTTAGDGYVFGINAEEDVIHNNLEATNTIFFTSGAERLRIDSDGQVQIGSGTIHGGGHLTIRGGGVNTYATLDYQYVGTPSNNSTTIAQLRFTANTTGASVVQGAKIQAVSDAAWSATGDAPTRLEFHTVPDGSASMQERLRIHSDGKMSLGTSSSASAKFNISHGNELALYTSGPYNYQAKFESTDAEAAIVIEDVNSGSNYNRIGVITNDMTFITNNNERLRIASDGQVIIGTTIPITIRYTGTGHPYNNNNYTLHGFSNIGLVGQYSTLNMPMDHSAATTAGNWWMLGRSSGNTNEWGLSTRPGNSNNLRRVWRCVTRSQNDGILDYQTFHSFTGTETLRIDSSSRALINNRGNTMPGLSANADDLVIGYGTESNETGMTMYSTSTSGIRFNDNSGTDAAIEYSHSARELRFNSAGNNRLQFGVNASNSPVFSFGTGHYSGDGNNHNQGDRASVKVGGYLHLESGLGGGHNAKAGLGYNCYFSGNENFNCGTKSPSGGDNRPAAYGMGYGNHYFYSDASSTAHSAQASLTMTKNMVIYRQGYVTKPNQPAFFATHTGTDGSTSDQNLIELTTTRYNKNSCYSTSSYYFTAPVAGVYFFTGQVWAKNGTSHARWQFSYYNGSSWSSITQHGFHGNGVNKTDFMQNASITYYMNSGDRMGMRVDNGPLAYYRGGGGAAHTYFCGHLVG